MLPQRRRIKYLHDVYDIDFPLPRPACNAGEVCAPRPQLHPDRLEPRAIDRNGPLLHTPVPPSALARYGPARSPPWARATRTAHVGPVADAILRPSAVG